MLVQDVKKWYYYLWNETSSHYELVAPTRVRRTAKQRNIITSSELQNTQNKNEKLIHCTVRCMVLPTAPTPSYQGREFSHALPILCAKKWNKMKVTFQTHIIKVKCYHLQKLENYFRMNNNVCKHTIKVNKLQQKLSSILHCVLKIILHFVIFHVKNNQETNKKNL